MKRRLTILFLFFVSISYGQFQTTLDDAIGDSLINNPVWVQNLAQDQDFQTALEGTTLSVSWNDLTDVPAGFADNVDDTGGGGAGATSLNELNDVNTGGQSTGDILRFDGTNYVPVSAYVTDIIWAEESGGLAVNGREYSMGNGATGGNNWGIPIWEDMEIIGMVMNAEVAGTSATATYTINAVNGAESITITSNSGVSYFTTPVSVSQGDLLNFRTTALNGTFSDARVAVIIKKEIKFE